MRLAIGLALTVGSTSSCKSTIREPVPAAELEIGDARVVTGPVGIGIKERTATYVLVDVSNRGDPSRGDTGAVVTMGGELLDLAEESLGALRTETLRVPAGETRMFALIDNKIESLEATAMTAQVALVRATRPGKKSVVAITSPNQSMDEGRAVIEAYVENLSEGRLKVMVIGAFYDASGKPMMRRATLYPLAHGGKRSAQFVGPVGSVSGVIYAGDVGL